LKIAVRGDPQAVYLVSEFSQYCRNPSSERRRVTKELTMKPISIKRTVFAVVLTCGTFGSADLSRDGGLTLSVESAQARVGRPLTPVSVAGVARRTTRRAVVGGAAVGAAAVGTACVRVLVNGTYVCR